MAKRLYEGQFEAKPEIEVKATSKAVARRFASAFGESIETMDLHAERVEVKVYDAEGREPAETASTPAKRPIRTPESGKSAPRFTSRSSRTDPDPVNDPQQQHEFTTDNLCPLAQALLRCSDDAMKRVLKFREEAAKLNGSATAQEKKQLTAQLAEMLEEDLFRPNARTRDIGEIVLD